MIKTYSTKTNRFYDSIEEADFAEIEFDAAHNNEAKIAELNSKIADVKAKQKTEITGAQKEIAEIEKKINDLFARKARITANMTAIDTEANLEINEHTKAIEALKSNTCCCKKTAEQKNEATDECSIQIKTFNSDTDDDWKTIIDAKGTSEEVAAKLDKLAEDLIKKIDTKDDSFKKLLEKFNI